MPAERDSYATLCSTPAGFAQVKELISKKTPLLQPSGLDGKTPPGAEFKGETPITLAARATRYREQQAQAGAPISQIKAVCFATSNPRAGL